MPRILTKIRIDEVSAVDKGAGKGTKVVIMKRDSDVITRATAALRESLDSIVNPDSEQAAALAETLEQFKSYLAKGADDADRDDGDGVQRFSQMFSSPKQAEGALACIIAARRRLNKADDAKTREELKSERAANLKSLNAVAICKALVEDQHAYSITEAELVELIGNHDRRDGESTAKCFARHFEAPTEDGAAIRAATGIAKAAEFDGFAGGMPIQADPYDVRVVGDDDARDVHPSMSSNEAIEQLKVLGRQKWPTATEAQQFANAFSDPANAELAAMAHRRPSATTVYPMPER